MPSASGPPATRALHRHATPTPPPYATTATADDGARGVVDLFSMICERAPYIPHCFSHCLCSRKFLSYSCVSYIMLSSSSVPATATEEAALVIETKGDQMGLHAQLGTDGPNATCFCLFCRGKLTKEDCTTLPGWPQLPDVPADWALPRALRNKARTYVGRHHPYARFDPRGAAAKPEPRSLAGMRTQAAGYKYKAACELARK